MDYILVESEFEALLLEASLIKKKQPKYNIRLKDDKSSLYIKITQEIYPRVFASRKGEGGFGPFPKTKTVRSVLRTLRRIFPFRSCRQLPSKPCLYFYLKLCPGICFRHSRAEEKSYRKTILYLQGLLNQKRKKVIESLKKEMEKAAREENFELAKDLRDKIWQIDWLIKKRHTADEYLENPHLLSELRQKELLDLAQILKVRSSLRRIEGFDISNIVGKMATGGMVVFLDGEEDKSFYRRFRIKTKKTPDDVAMVKEVLSRRLKHQEWQFPDLIFIDGGKGQVAGAIKVLNKLNLKIPVVGLVKRIETLIVPELKMKSEKLKVEFVEVNLPQDSPALNLLKRIRDEAHRFARSYHLKLRERLV